MSIVDHQSTSIERAEKTQAIEKTASNDTAITAGTDSVFIKRSKNINGKRVWDKGSCCTFCEITSTNLSKHILKKHSTEPEVQKILSLPKGSKDRALLLEKIRNLGNYQQNCKVLKIGRGVLVPYRCPSDDIEVCADDYGPCSFCLGFFLKKELWRHEKCCKHKGNTLVRGRKVIARSQLLLPSDVSHSDKLKDVLAHMAMDSIGLTVKNDLLVSKFGERLCNKHSHLPHRITYIVQKMRELGRLVRVGRSMRTFETLSDFIDPKLFPEVIAAVKKLCCFREDDNSFSVPTLALKLGHSLKKCASILRSEALIAQDKALEKKCKAFYQLCEMRWNEEVSSSALSTLDQARWNSQHVLPLTESLRMLNRYLMEQSVLTYELLKQNQNAETWLRLAKITLANIILFNRKRSGEASRILISDFEKAKNNKSQPRDDVLESLSKVEKILVNNFLRVEIMGKRGRAVPILLTPKIAEGIQLLCDTRENIINPENRYLFGRPFFHSLGHLRGHDCLRELVLESKVESPENITSTKLRKHVATVSQILNLTDHELDQLCSFMGHDVRVHREFYRLPEDTLQLAKMSRLLIALDKGTVSSFKGQRLEDISLNVQDITKDLSGEEDEEEEEEEKQDEEGRTENKASNKDISGDSEESDAEFLPKKPRKPQKGRGKSICVKNKNAQRDVLNEDEIASVAKYFETDINSLRLPGKAKCEAFLQEDVVFMDTGRSWLKIKATVRNLIAKRQRSLRK
ncbi:hypothetical protein EGW08_011685 [Elysia chlorotica]|uniref:Uncharacterized protein n=1 Tax=Elysia chlorotica TaxID=188477 RepID=A0A3S0ZLI5_ELYCH|nr:hypothetical protein EGW08_011685 [Elysia chlorotica]